MTFAVFYDKQPSKFLKKMDKHTAKRIITKLDALFEKGAVPHDAKSLVGEHGVYRIRIGDYRAIYRINYDTKKIIVFKIEKRAKAY